MMMGNMPDAVKLNLSFVSEQGRESFSVISPIYVGRRIEKVVD